MDGLIMDAEGGPDFFRGGVNEAHTYGNAMREVANNPKKLLGIFSNDIPQNLPGWLPKFNEIATKAPTIFIQLCKDRGYQGYSLWHWGGAPMPLWEVLNKTTAVRTTNNIKSARTARRRHRTLRP